MFSSTTSGLPLSAADVAAVTNGGNDGFGGWGGGAWIWVILIAVLFGWGGFGGGFGGYGGGYGMQTINTDYLAQGMRDIQGNLASNFLTLNNETLSGICDIQSSIANGTASVTNAVTNGFNTQNLANLQNTNAIQRDINSGVVAGMQNTYALQSTLAQMASDQRADTAQTNYNLATQFCAANNAACSNTRDIVDAVNAGNRAIIAKLDDAAMQAKDARIAELEQMNNRLSLAASQSAQNQYLVQTLRPSPIPAYQVSNPYAYSYGYYGGTTVA